MKNFLSKMKVKNFDVQYYGSEDKNENLSHLFGAEEIRFHVLNYNLPQNIKLGFYSRRKDCTNYFGFDKRRYLFG